VGEIGTNRLGRHYRRLWAASTTSALGSGLATVAAPLLVASRNAGPLVVSASFAVAWLPWLLFALPGGVLVDRVDRRRLMIVIDWVRAVAVLALAAVVPAGPGVVPVLYVVLFVLNSGEVVFRSASQALVPAVVRSEQLERANGRLFGGLMLMQGMVAGPLGGFLFAAGASLPFLVNGGTYLASAVLIGLVGGGYRAGRAVDDRAVDGSAVDGRAVDGAGGVAARSVRREIVEGFRWLAGQRLLRTMAVLIGLLNVTLTAATAVLVLVATQRLHLGPVGYGLLTGCTAVGGVAGALAGHRLIGRLTATWTIRIGLLIETATHLVLAVSGSPWLIGATLLAFGVHGALWGMVASTMRQRLTPEGMRGRVGSTTLFVSAGGNCAGAVLGGVLVDRFGLAAPYWLGFGVAMVVTAATWRVFDPASVAAAYRPVPGRAGDAVG
jgi:MFS family permease